MKDKKVKAIFTIITFILIIFIGILVKNILSKENKEVSIAEDFIHDLAEKNIIDYYDKNDEINKNEVLNTLVNQNSQIKYSVLVGNYGVDIDKDYNIIGFSNKNISNLSSNLKVATYSLVDIEVVDEEKAIDYANRYIKEISNDEFKFKEVKNKSGEDNPYYIVVFYKCKDGYPIYKQEITTLIDKESWKLQGYSNYPLGKKDYINDIKIDEEYATNIVLDSYRNINLIKDDIETIDTAYVETEKDKLVLSYVFNIKNKKEDKASENYLVLIRSDNGEIISSNLETIKKN